MKETVKKNLKEIQVALSYTRQRDPRHSWRGWLVNKPKLEGDRLYIPFNAYLDSGYIDLTDGSLHPVDVNQSPVYTEELIEVKLNAALKYIKNLCEK